MADQTSQIAQKVEAEAKGYWQANVRIIDATAKRMNLAPAQVYVKIASYGNTSAATIPIALT